MGINTSEIIEAVTRRHSSYLVNEERGRANRLARWLNTGCELNEGVPPTVDSDGRLHAPHDGYVWTWIVLRDGEIVAEYEKECLGGEFLPLGESVREQTKTNTSRIAYVPLDVAERLVDGLKPCLDIGHGQPFEGRDGLCCHLYVNTKCKDAVTIIEDAIRAPQIEAKAKREAEEAAVYAAAEEVPEGHVEVTGELLTIRHDENRWGVVTKILVRDVRGFKVWGSRPEALNEARRGDTVTFTGTVTQSSDDPKFGFFKRPTKASIVEAVEVAA